MCHIRYYKDGKRHSYCLLMQRYLYSLYGVVD